MARFSEIIPEESVNISNRFFEAVDYLISKKKIRGLKTIADIWKIDRSSLSTAKSHPGKKRIKVEYIYYLQRDFGISSNWIISGEGTMTK